VTNLPAEFIEIEKGIRCMTMACSDLLSSGDGSFRHHEENLKFGLSELALCLKEVSS
jgi:hypothetical protein